MRPVFFSLCLLAAAGWCDSASAVDRVRGRSRSTSTTTCVNGVCTTTAQEDASVMARTGRFAHSGRSNVREGIGFSTSSPEDALNRCCFSGRYPVAEESVVRGPGGWYAVRRYGSR